jgi:hypothetical protein
MVFLLKNGGRLLMDINSRLRQPPGMDGNARLP